jgi:hypothetical protein
VRKRAYTAIVFWQDGEEEDADEMTIYATSAGEAASLCRTKWRCSVQTRWPNAKITEVVIKSRHGRGVGVKTS